MDRGLVDTNAAKPAQSVLAGIGRNIQSRQEANKPPRFVRLGKGLIGLSGAERDVAQPAVKMEGSGSAGELELNPSSPRNHVRLTALDAAAMVLRKAGTALHYKTIAERILKQRLWTTKGKTPEHTVNARILSEIAKGHGQSRFRQVGPGVFTLSHVSSVVESPIQDDPTPERREAHLSLADAAERVLLENDSQEPLHYQEIAHQAVSLGLVATKAEVPAASLNSGISSDIQRRLKANRPQRFVRLGGGRIRLAGSDQEPRINTSSATTSKPRRNAPTLDATNEKLCDAAERVLREDGGQEPLHCREIARRILDYKLVETMAVTPVHTLSAAISSEIRHRREAGEQQRFSQLCNDLIGLADAEPEAVRNAIDAQNRRVRGELMEFLRETDPIVFEQSVRELFYALGAERVEVTQRTSDGGVDLRGTLLMGGTIPIRFAAQVKRWRDQVGSSVARAMRGTIRYDESGLIVTASGFTSSAKNTAQSTDRKAITLIDGDALVDLMIEHEICVRRQQNGLLTLATPGPNRSAGSA